MRTKEAEMELVYKLLHVLDMVRRSSDSFSVLQLNCYYEFLPIWTNVLNKLTRIIYKNSIGVPINMKVPESD